MAQVLVTGVGGAGGTATVRSLRQHTDHHVVGVDMDENATGFLFVEEYSTVPAANASTWPNVMANLVDEYDIDVIVPLVDEELARLERLRAVLPDSVGVVAPQQPVIDTTLDKYTVTQTLARAGISVPSTVVGSEWEDHDLSYPLIGKPRHGRGSRGVERLDSSDDIESYLTSTDKAPEEVVLQECIDGTEYTTSVVSTRNDRLLSIVPKEVLLKEGNTIHGATRAAQSVETACRDIYYTLEPHGPLNVQQIVADGEPYTIEINPRFSSTACLTVAAGVNELDLLIRDHLGESVSPVQSFVPDRHLIRYLSHTIRDETDLHPPMRER